MSFTCFWFKNLQLLKSCKSLIRERALFSSVTSSVPEYENRKDENLDKVDKNDNKTFYQLAEHRFVYPEFLPHPAFEMRNKIREKLERMDMLRRRTVVNIPEFYVGSILSVTTADPYSPGKENRFVGICIARTYIGLRATFTLRNVVDELGVEILYDLYNPTIQKIEVLVLEKRLDEELYYLRDAPPKYSTFPFDMEAELRVEGDPIPINPLKIKLNPPPWTSKWERAKLKGIEELDLSQLQRFRLKRLERSQAPWEDYDLMKKYRQCIPEEDQREIWEDVEAHKLQFQSKKMKWKQQTLLKAKKRTKL